MKRWVLAFAIVASLGGALAASVWLPSNKPPPAVPDDEILAFELHPSRAVLLKVPGAIDELALTTWCVVSPQSNYDPATLYAYSVKVDFLDLDQRLLATEVFEPETRVSLQSPQGVEARSAWLVDSNDWVTDSRTLTITTAKKLPKGGFLRVEMLRSEVSTLLLRATFREKRMAIERAAHEESLDLRDRRKLMGLRSSLGSDDLPPDERSSALLFWGRRLDAVGLEGRDFFVRRLLLSDFRASLPTSVGPQLGFDIGPRHAVAFNVSRAIKLDVLTPVGKEVRVVQGGAVVGSEDRSGVRVTTIDVPANAPRTLILDTPSLPDVRARFLVRNDEASAQIGVSNARPFDAERVEISPDVRVMRFYALEDNRPIVARMAPGQRMLRVVVRGEQDPTDSREAWEGRISARWIKKGGAVETANLVVGLTRSKLDRWRASADPVSVGGKAPPPGTIGGDATDARAAILRVPKDVEQVEILGDPNVRVSLYTDDPQVQDDELRLPYRLQLAEKEVWRNAPHDLSRWAHLVPSNATSLDADRRYRDLAAQVRIELEGAGRVPLPERGLTAEGTPVARHLLEASTYSPGTPFPPDAWTPLTGPSTWLRIEREGPRAGALSITYVADEERLGESVKLLSDSVMLTDQVAMVRAGELQATVAPGEHEIAIDGIGKGGVAYANAAPRARGPIVRRRVLAELTAEHPIVFHVPQPPNTPLTVVLFVASEGASEPWGVHYDIDGGGPKEREGKFFRAITRPRGAVGGRTGDAGAGSFWETSGSASDRHGLSKGKIPIGDDLEGNTRSVRVFLDGSNARLWVRAVVVGEGDPAPVDGVRMWVEE